MKKDSPLWEIRYINILFQEIKQKDITLDLLEYSVAENNCKETKYRDFPIEKILEQRNKTFKKSDEAMLYETFDVIDTGIVVTDLPED